MKFIMTGHKGLIGSFLLERLKKLGHEPILLIDLKEGQDVANILDKKLDEKVNVMIHLASFCKVNKIIKSPELAFHHNVLGTYRILEFCRKNKIPKIIFTSSSRILSKEKNPYTASKIYGEEICMGYCQCYGIDYVIIRPSTVYGPFNDKSARVTDIFIRNALHDKDLKIYGDEEKTLDFTYIDDFVDGFLFVMDKKNEDYDISQGEGIKLSYVADMIIKWAGRGKKKFLPKEIAQPQRIQLNISKIKALGYKAKVGIEEGMKRTFDWYKENLEEIDKSRE
jgi:nucleoside-diphosphate-sugar epimerase